MSKFTVTEIPLVTQDHQALAQRYEIRTDLSFSKCSRNSDKNQTSRIWSGKYEEWQSRVRGCAATCVSDDATVVSAACVEEPYVISVTKVVNCDLTMVEIDLEHLDRNLMGDVIKTFIFVHQKETDGEDEDDMVVSSLLDKTIKMLLIDSQSNVLQIELDYISLSPITLAHTPTNAILSQQHIYPLNRHSLTSTQVVAVDENRVVFALSPFILCLNVKSQKIAVWSKESCLYNRRKSLSGVLKSAKDILVGKPYDDTDEIVDPPSSNLSSAVALCAFDEMNYQVGGCVEGKIVCSLHSDGTLRLWTLPSFNQTFPYPKQMYILHDLDDAISGSSIIPPQVWKSYDDSVLINGCTFIEAKGGGVRFVIAVGIHTADNFAESKVHLTTFVGSIGSRVDLMESVEMKVPDQIISLKLMEFTKLAQGWEMHALFNVVSNPLFDDGKSLYHSFSHAPVLRTTLAVYKSGSPLSPAFYSSCFLDDLLATERWRLEYECVELSTNADFFENENTEGALNSIDQWYLQKIFRSDLMQTIGLYKATDGAIIRALRSVVPPFCLNDDTITDVHKKGIEFLTAFVMNKWSKYEGDRLKKHDMSSGSPILSNKIQPESLSSVYREFYRKERDTPDITEDSDSSFESSEVEWNRYSIKLHHQRWEKLLTAINNEETKLLLPLALFNVPGDFDERKSLLIRPGVTSVILLGEQSNSDSPADKLDSIAFSMLDQLENSSSKNRHLLTTLEMKTWQIISKAKLLKNDISRSFVAFVRGAISDIDCDDWNTIQCEVSSIMERMSEEQLILWLKSPCPTSFPSDGKMSDLHSANSSSAALPSCKRLCRQHIRYLRRLTFAKYICVISLSVRKMIPFTAEQETLSFIAYLNTVGVSWACAQTCTSSAHHLIKAQEDPFELSKSNKYFSSTDVMAGKRYFLDEVLKKVYGPIGSTSLANTSMELSKLFIQLAFQPFSDDIHSLLDILSSDDSEETKRISLRLLCPSVAFSSDTIDCYDRKCMAADYLLSEVTYLATNHNISPEKIAAMEEIASCLLKWNHSLLPDPATLNIILNSLNGCEEHSVSNDQNSYKRHETEVLRLIEDMFTIASNQPLSFISSIVNMEKVKSLLLPLVIKAHHAGLNPLDILNDRLRMASKDPILVLRHFLSVTLVLNNCLLRLHVLKKHSYLLNFPTKVSFANVLKSAINDVIETVEYHSHPSDYDQIIDYPALWSTLFRVTVQGHCWDDAFSACLSNPLKDRQMKNFKRLVTAMADAGALGLLVDKIVYGTVEGTLPGKEIDLYEVAIDTLADASCQASLTSTLQHSAFSSNADYSCCLYSLHTAYNNWRRSSQTADFYGALTLKRISTPNNDLSSLAAVPHKEKSKIMNDLTLASVASAQLLFLVEDINSQFIVSGEVDNMVDKIKLSRYSYDHELERSLRREHESYETSLKLSCSTRNNTQRLNQLYNAKDLLLRAKRMIVLGRLQKDRFCPDNISEILLASDTAIVDALSRLGYVDDAIAFSHCKKENKHDTNPQGRDILLDALSHIICNCLGQAAFPCFRLNFSHEQEVENDILTTRPTLDQIAILLGDNSRFFCTPKLWQTDGSLFHKGPMVLELIRCYTELYSRFSLELPIELANAMLQSDIRAKLPSWLINIIVCPTSSSCNGLFARHGNPSELLNLYIKYGLYIEACALVEVVLLRRFEHKGNVTAASARLPEKGHIDYVPYETIDLLWNLIETIVASKSLAYEARSKLLRSRQDMERALHTHFGFTKIIEDGLSSARILFRS
jgi:hypothetical protein